MTANDNDNDNDRTDGFERPTPISDVLLAFPADVTHLVPLYEEIPARYKTSEHPMRRFQSDLFCGELDPQATIETRAGIDMTAAARHLRAVNGTYAIKHEHKTAAVAYLADRWIIFSNAVRYAPATSRN